MQNNFAKISPNPLSIIITKDPEKKIHYNLTIENLINKYLIFQISVNKKGILFAKPSSSYISPFQNISVEINIHKNNLISNEYKNIILKVVIIPYDEEIKSVEQAKNLYHVLKKQQIKKQDIFVTLNFVKEEIIDTNIIQENTNINENNDNNIEKSNMDNYINMRNQLISKNEEILKNIEINRKKLENMMEDNGKLHEKAQLKRNKKYNYDNLIMISLILFGLIMGSNFAIGYNKFFKK